MTISPDILIKDLLKIISQRRSLPVDHLTVSLMDPPIPVDINRTLRSLNCDELVGPVPVGSSCVRLLVTLLPASFQHLVF